MPVIADPEDITASVLNNIAQFSGARVLEVGCGKGRITFGYAENTRHVTAIDPMEDDIQSANQNKPAHLEDRINFLESTIEDFLQPAESEKYDIVLYTFSL
jgi:2-polyprenyl-3-methyl-5-hydroxy-6-metoxy-1,4-benzoquinol methylase